MSPSTYLKISRAEYKDLSGAFALLLSAAPNTQYGAKDIASVLCTASVEKASLEAVCGCRRQTSIAVPSSDDVFYRLAKDNTPGSVSLVITSLITHSVLKASPFLNRRTAVDVAIDIHNVPYYGKPAGELALWLRHSREFRGTCLGFAVLTASVVVKGRRFVIAVVPLHTFANIPELVEKTIREARRYVRLRYVFLDRGFYSVDVIRTLYKLDVRFVIPVVRHRAKRLEKDIVQQLRRHYNDRKERFSYTLGDGDHTATFTVVAVKEWEDPDVMGFATNTRLPARTIGEWYGKRWGIETGYRVEEQFRARTCARASAAVRLLFVMLPFALYNLWVLVNLLIRWGLHRGRFLPNDQSYVTVYQLGKLLLEHGTP